MGRGRGFVFGNGMAEGTAATDAVLVARDVVFPEGNVDLRRELARALELVADEGFFFLGAID